MRNVQHLLDRIEQLEAILGVDRSTCSRIREALGIEPRHAQIVGMLLSREFVTRDGLYTVLFESLPECEWPDEKILDVQICKLRAQLKHNDIELEIKTKWGEGWSMSREEKARLRAMLASSDAQAVAPVMPDVTARRLAFMDGR